MSAEVVEIVKKDLTPDQRREAVERILAEACAEYNCVALVRETRFHPKVADPAFQFAIVPKA